MGTSPGRVSQALGIILLNLLLFAPILLVGQKSALQQTVTISVSDISIADVLDKLGDKCSVRFTYDPDDISAYRLVSLQVKNMPLSEVLTKVFEDNSINFRERGGQVIIFRDRSIIEPISDVQIKQSNVTETPGTPVKNKIPDKDNNQVKPPSKEKPAGNRISRPDTIFITRHDTILRFDTILRIDTLMKHDTVFIKTSDVFPQNPSGKKDKGFFADLSGAYLLSEMILSASGVENENLAEKLKSTGTKNLPGYSAGVGFGYRSNRWTFHSGAYYTRFHQSFNYTYEHQTGGYFETDTIERYYTLSGPDTSWFYITDSTWLEKQVSQYNYKGQNQFSYIEFPFSISFSVYHRNFDIYLSGGAIAGVLPSSVGSFIDPEPDYPASSLKEISLNTFILSVTGGAGARFSLNKHAGLFTEVAYRQQLSSVFKDYPVSAKFGSVSFRFGLSYLF